jgi:hypothetical protein
MRMHVLQHKGGSLADFGVVEPPCLHSVAYMCVSPHACGMPVSVSDHNTSVVHDISRIKQNTKTSYTKVPPNRSDAGVSGMSPSEG